MGDLDELNKDIAEWLEKEGKRLEAALAADPDLCAYVEATRRKIEQQHKESEEE